MLSSLPFRNAFLASTCFIFHSLIAASDKINLSELCSITGEYILLELVICDQLSMLNKGI